MLSFWSADRTLITIEGALLTSERSPIARGEMEMWLLENWQGQGIFNRFEASIYLPRLQSMGSLSRTRLSGFTLTFHFDALEKEMATHSSVLTWRIPGTGEPGGLPTLWPHRVGHD